LSAFEDVKIVAAAEIDVKRGKKIAEKWNIPTVYRDYSEMYENSNLNAVFICLPIFLHHQAVKDALQHDLHVFCEKPMGFSSDDAYELVRIADKRNLVLTVGYNRRHTQNYEKAVHIVESMRLGKITQIQGVLVSRGPYAGWIPSSDWSFEEKGGGALYDIGCHLFDLMIHILSDKITEVLASSTSIMHLRTPHNIAGTFKTEKETLGTFNLGWQTAIDYDFIQVHGTGGSLLVSPFEFEEIHGSHGMLGKIVSHLKSAKRIMKMGIGVSNKKPDETYFKEDRAFINSIISNEKPPVTGKDALHILEVLESTRESLKDGKSVKVKRHF